MRGGQDMCCLVHDGELTGGEPPKGEIRLLQCCKLFSGAQEILEEVRRIMVSDQKVVMSVVDFVKST